MNNNAWYDAYVEELLACDCVKRTSHMNTSLGVKDPCGHWDNDINADMLSAALKRHAKKAKVKNYIYLVTFTLDPAKHPVITDELCSQIEDYITSQAKRTALHITKMSFVKEFHKNGRPHWHACVRTTKSLRSDAFVQYSRVYGKVDISKNKHTNDTDIITYMSKDANPITIL